MVISRYWLLVSSLALLVVLSACTGGSSSVQAQALGSATPSLTPIDWKRVDQAMGKAGTQMPGGVYKYSLPRTDLSVTLGGVHLKAGFALGGYVAFLPMMQGTLAMGDLVLLQEEINPVMTALQQQGIEQTALHNHLLGESSHVMYLHIGGQGDPVQLAQAIHTALLLTKTPLTPVVFTPANQIDLDTGKLDAILGYQGKANNGVYQYSIPRAEQVTEAGMVLPPAIGVATALNFQSTGDGNAAITGDFALIAKEVPFVLRALREHGIEVTALHNHMITDEPHLFYVHFWANANALQLAQGLRAALDQTNSAKPTR